MTSHLSKLVHYNIWANAQFIEIISSLTEEQMHQKIAGSFDSIYRTTFHLYLAESIWNQRMALAETVIIPDENAGLSIAEICTAWAKESTRLQHFVSSQKREDWHTHELTYMDSKKTRHKDAIQHIIMHVCNHATFHRGQLVNFLRAVGITKLPSTDFIAFARKMKL
jgi:uncharacterized damage-inducible protein DinB